MARTGPDGFVVFLSVPAGEYDLRTDGRILRKNIGVLTAQESDLAALKIDQGGDLASG